MEYKVGDTIELTERKRNGRDDTTRYVIEKEYPRYYLCWVEIDGKKLYRETFMKDVATPNIEYIPEIKNSKWGRRASNFQVQSKENRS